MITRKIVFFLFVCTVLIQAGDKDIRYDDYFLDATMRVDYYHTGTATEEVIAVDQIYKQGTWSGRRDRLIDVFNRGKYAVRIFDKETDNLIYSKGYDTYFGEYRTTNKALDGIYRAYLESVLFPFPVNTVRLEILERDKNQKLRLLFQREIEPDDMNIIEHAHQSDIQVYKTHYSGEPGDKVDIAILGDGYTLSEAAKFEKDMERFTEIFFSKAPFATRKERFNIFGVLKPSDESGCDEPTKNIFKNTALSTTFNSLGSPRYLLTEDMKALQDIAAAAPSDFLLIMVNNERYGGGGIYNFFATFTSDNEWSDFVFIHEFGHHFAGLADEYYDSATAYNDFYPDGIEPLEPNITRLYDRNNVKWAEQLSENIPVPTPWEKSGYDSVSAAFIQSRTANNREIARLTRERANQTVIDSLKQAAEQLAARQHRNLSTIIEKSTYFNKVGVFEGAGYISEGMYRPMLDCTMFRIGRQDFCEVCRHCIVEIIDFYSKD